MGGEDSEVDVRKRFDTVGRAHLREILRQREDEDDARRVMDVLSKRLGKYGLTLHPDESRSIDFRRPRFRGGDGRRGPGTFDLLGFTHRWARSRRGYWVVKRRTAKDRRSRALRRLARWFSRNLSSVPISRIAASRHAPNT